MALLKVGVRKYRVSVSFRVPGKPHPTTKTKIVHGTESEARAVESALLQELKSRSLKGYYVGTFADALDLYLENLIEEKGGYCKTHGRHVALLRRELGHIKIDRFADYFKSWYKHFKTALLPNGKPRNTATVQRRLSIVKAAFNVLVKKKHIAANPITNDDYPRYKIKARKRLLSIAERQRFMQAIREHAPDIEPIVSYMFEMPCRLSELIGARREQYHPISNTIYIPMSKAGMSIDKSVPPEMTDYFRSIPDESEWLFYRRNRSGEYLPITQSYLVEKWDICLKAAGITDFRRHDTRHQAVTDLINAGTPPNIVALMAGWKSIDMLKTYYELDSLMMSKFVVFPSMSGVVEPPLRFAMAN